MKFTHVWLVQILAVTLNGLLLSTVAGEIKPAGQQLAKVLDSMHVEHLWLADLKVDWRTGEPNGEFYTNANSDTHCSAFAAAAAAQLGIHLLHPPEHSVVLLANAQQDWLCGEGTNEGWQLVKSSIDAQQLANNGVLVVVTYKNPNEERPGHIAIVRPSTKSDHMILAEGPDIIQAGAHNYTCTTTKKGFKHHPGAFENCRLLYYSHPVPLLGNALRIDRR